MKKIIELFWPESCVLCGKAYKGGLCPECSRKERSLRVGDVTCFRCGKQIEHEVHEYCGDCRKKEHLFTQGAALWVYNEWSRRAIYRFKNQNQRSSVHLLIRLLWEQYEGRVRRWDPDVIIPIPLHKIKLRKRGFNQAQLLAEELSEKSGIPVNPGLLIRTGKTGEQKKMDVLKRRVNMKNAFSLRERIEAGTKVLLVDDVYTTGNTVDAAAEVLKKGGAKEVFFLTICIGQGY